MWLHRCFFASLMALIAAYIPVRAESPDSLAAASAGDSAAEEAMWKPEAKELILPVALIAGGSVAASVNLWERDVDCRVSDWLDAGRALRVADYLQYLPYAGFLGAEYIGAQPKVAIVDRALLAASSFIILEAITQPVKRIAHRTRPNHVDRHSFPSGHSATAFAGAELTRMIYGDGLGAVAYVVASGVAAMRISGGHHYLSDCIAGAGIGILSARLSAWLIPFERRLLRLDPKPASAPALAFVPLAWDGGAGCALTLSF